MEFLGTWWLADEVLPIRTTMQVAIDLLEVQNAHDVRSFTGLCLFYGRFVHHFSSKAAPLTILMKKHQAFVWGREQHETFEQLKSALCEALVLAHPQDDLPRVVAAHGSLVDTGGVLIQEHAQGPRPIAFEAHRLS